MYEECVRCDGQVLVSRSSQLRIRILSQLHIRIPLTGLRNCLLEADHLRMYFTPEFESTVVLLASPFASCVALFCMRAPSTSTADIEIKNPTIEIKSASKVLPWHSKTKATSEASGGATRA